MANARIIPYTGSNVSVRFMVKALNFFNALMYRINVSTVQQKAKINNHSQSTGFGY